MSLPVSAVCGCDRSVDTTLTGLSHTFFTHFFTHFFYTLYLLHGNYESQCTLSIYVEKRYINDKTNSKIYNKEQKNATLKKLINKERNQIKYN